MGVGRATCSSTVGIVGTVGDWEWGLGLVAWFWLGIGYYSGYYGSGCSCCFDIITSILYWLQYIYTHFFTTFAQNFGIYITILLGNYFKDFAISDYYGCCP